MAALAPSTSGARAALSSKQSLRASAPRLAAAAAPRAAVRPSRASVAVLAYKATVKNADGTHVIDVAEGDTVLSACIDAGLDVPYDCQMGTCLRCAARLVSSSHFIHSASTTSIFFSAHCFSFYFCL